MNMDQERMHHLMRDGNDWLNFGGMNPNENADQFFARAREQFAKNASGSGMFERFVRDQEQSFSQRFSQFFTAPGELNMETFNHYAMPTEGRKLSQKRSESRSSGGSKQMSATTASWAGTDKIEFSRSTFYCTHINSYRFSGEPGHNSFTGSFDSESESEEDETPAITTSPRMLAIEARVEEPCTVSLAPSELSETSTEVDVQRSPKSDPTTPTQEQRRERTFRIANELLTTERSYVAVLHLIDQVFHFRVDQENRAHSMFPQETVPQMFSNIKSIFMFHNDFLLPQLEERMRNWEKDPRIGDIMKKSAPFLKLYTEYVKNFDSAMSIINALQSKNPRFAAIMNEIHQMPKCGNLTLTHHMLSPIQRIPRYELLLKDYLKKLPDDSNDREDSEKALHLVSTAANHANEAMKKISQFQQLLEIQENISGAVDLVSPTRELLKEGRVHKISARSGDHQERYLFLLSDILLLCSPRLISNRVISGPTYRLRVKFDVESLQILEGDNLETANTFYVRDMNKNVELYTQTIEEKSAWLDALFRAIEELYRRKSSLRIIPDNSNSENSPGSVPGQTDGELGKRAPHLVRMDSVNKCMDCGAGFGVMRRKHHCHACGMVVCGKCSGQKMPLVFEDNKMCRVCHACHKILAQNSAPNSPGPETATPTFNRGRGLLDVPANAQCVLNGYMQLKTPKSWTSRWFALHSDFVLYSFRSHNEKRAMTATPVPGYTVTRVSYNKNQPDSEKDRIFKMFHSKKTYYFQTNTKEELERWVATLQKAAVAELPTPENVSL